MYQQKGESIKNTIFESNINCFALHLNNLEELLLKREKKILLIVKDPVVM